MPSSSHRYSGLSIALHWLTLLLIVAVYACMELRELWPKGDPTREAVKSWHYTLGLTVFTLTLLRVAVRLARPAPPIVPDPPAWQKTLSHLIHMALYVLLLAMPIGGWLILSAEGQAIPFWGFELPALVGKSEWLAGTVEEIHETVGKIGYFLIALHAAGALFHHHVVKDNTLARMLPGKSGLS